MATGLFAAMGCSAGWAIILFFLPRAILVIGYTSVIPDIFADFENQLIFPDCAKILKGLQGTGVIRSGVIVSLLRLLQATKYTPGAAFCRIQLHDLYWSYCVYGGAM